MFLNKLSELFSYVYIYYLYDGSLVELFLSFYKVGAVHAYYAVTLFDRPRETGIPSSLLGNLRHSLLFQISWYYAVSNCRLCSRFIFCCRVCVISPILHTLRHDRLAREYFRMNGNRHEIHVYLRTYLPDRQRDVIIVF
jgi:hypothetical protein